MVADEVESSPIEEGRGRESAPARRESPKDDPRTVSNSHAFS